MDKIITCPVMCGIQLPIHSQISHGAAFDVKEWISNFVPHIIMDAIIYPCWDWSYFMLATEALGGLNHNNLGKIFKHIFLNETSVADLFSLLNKLSIIISRHGNYELSHLQKPIFITGNIMNILSDLYRVLHIYMYLPVLTSLKRQHEDIALLFTARKHMQKYYPCFEYVNWMPPILINIFSNLPTIGQQWGKTTIKDRYILSQNNCNA